MPSKAFFTNSNFAVKKAMTRAYHLIIMSSHNHSDSPSRLAAISVSGHYDRWSKIEFNVIKMHNIRLKIIENFSDLFSRCF